MCVKEEGGIFRFTYPNYKIELNFLVTNCSCRSNFKGKRGWLWMDGLVALLSEFMVEWKEAPRVQIKKRDQSF